MHREPQHDSYGVAEVVGNNAIFLPLYMNGFICLFGFFLYLFVAGDFHSMSLFRTGPVPKHHPKDVKCHAWKLNRSVTCHECSAQMCVLSDNWLLRSSSYRNWLNREVLKWSLVTDSSYWSSQGVIRDTCTQKLFTSHLQGYYSSIGQSLGSGVVICKSDPWMNRDLSLRFHEWRIIFGCVHCGVCLKLKKNKLTSVEETLVEIRWKGTCTCNHLWLFLPLAVQPTVHRGDEVRDRPTTCVPPASKEAKLVTRSAASIFSIFAVILIAAGLWCMSAASSTAIYVWLLQRIRSAWTQLLGLAIKIQNAERHSQIEVWLESGQRRSYVADGLIVTV